MHKNLREAHEKISEQKMDLDSARDREVAAHERLAKTVSVAEKAIAERETFAKIVSVWIYLVHLSVFVLQRRLWCGCG